jgi:hypothetical protein
VSKNSQFGQMGMDDDVGAAYEWIDSGRRGNPAPGCDCEACFGMCIGHMHDMVRTRHVLRDQAVKLRREREERGVLFDGPLDLNMGEIYE